MDLVSDLDPAHDPDPTKIFQFKGKKKPQLPSSHKEDGNTKTWTFQQSKSNSCF